MSCMWTFYVSTLGLLIVLGGSKYSMERSFSVEKWPSGYSFTSRCRSTLYGYCIRLLNAVRWIPIIYALTLQFVTNKTNQAITFDAVKKKVFWWTLIAFASAEVFNRLYVTQETLIMLKGYGLQMEATSVTGQKSIRSIPICDIDHLLINEAILMNEVIFYLVIILKNSDELVLPFNNAIPRLEALKTVYRTFNEMFPAQTKNVEPERQ